MKIEPSDADAHARLKAGSWGAMLALYDAPSLGVEHNLSADARFMASGGWGNRAPRTFAPTVSPVPTVTPAPTHTVAPSFAPTPAPTPLPTVPPLPTATPTPAPTATAAPTSA